MEYNFPGSGFIKGIIDERLGKLVDRHASRYVRQYATHPDGTLDQPLAIRINREVQRRGTIGRELDIYEPLRWTGISFLLSAAVGAGIKVTTDKSFSRPALTTLMITTALTSAIQLVRILPRYEAGLRGGAETALTMHALDAETTYRWMDPAGPWTQKITNGHTHKENTLDV